MSKNFKVIISGGGPAGLVAAHSLHLAGIDFVRADILLEQGASLVLSPHSLRVCHQFGILERLLEIGVELKHQTAFAADGHLLGESNSLEYLHDNHGSGPIVFHRAQLVEVIYNGLPEQAKACVHAGKKIADVVSDEGGVKVTCADGSVYESSVLIGADGVHSRTRRQMRKLALASQPDIEWDDETPFASEYRCLWDSFPLPTEPGQGNETHDKDRSVMYLAGKNRGWIFLFEKLPHGTKDRISYSEQDIEQYAERFANYKISPDLKVKDVFNKQTAGMSTLEEDVLKHWSWGRIVLVGDACHKCTSNGGLGFNNGIQDVVAPCNHLHATVEAAQDRYPSFTDLSKTFHGYEVQRRQLAQAGLGQSAAVTRTHADANLLYYIFGHHIMWLGWVQYILSNVLPSRTIRDGLVLDYVATQEPLRGAIGWTYPMKGLEITSQPI